VRKLTVQELEHYDENGYVIVSDFFSLEELKAMDEEIENLEKSDDRVAPKHRDYSGNIYQLALLSERTRNFAEDERILTLIEDIVKPGISIYSSKLVAKLPHTNTVCHWHQDDAYYVSIAESKTRMSIWVPLLDATEENGCLWIVSGSHKQGLLPHENKNYGTCRKSLHEEQIDLSKATPVIIKAGSILLFSAMLWHSSKGNQTDTIRRAFIVSYQEASVQGGNGKQWKILRP
jgi:ectoine hydroxylase-related dioxygenase (phytanoyl-CoA dioxygenase family)